MPVTSTDSPPVQSPSVDTRRIDRASRIDVAHHGQRQSLWNAMCCMESLKHLPIDVFDAGDGASRATAIRVRPPYSIDINASTATAAGLSSSWRMSVTISPRRRSTSATGNDGRMTTSATSPSTSSRSSTRQVQASDSAWRVTEAARVTRRGCPAARRVRRPSIVRCRDRSFATRNARARAAPRCRARSLRADLQCSVTAGVVDVRLAMNGDAVSARTSRVGARPAIIEWARNDRRCDSCGLRRSAATLLTSAMVTASMRWEMVGYSCQDRNRLRRTRVDARCS